jgi:hypothetical protein
MRAAPAPAVPAVDQGEDMEEEDTLSYFAKLAAED